MTTSNKQKAREFWIGIQKGRMVAKNAVFETKPIFLKLVYADVIHVIEYSAFLALEQKLAKAVAALKFYGNPKQYDATDVIEGVEILEITGDSGELARETLASLGESEVGEG